MRRNIFSVARVVCCTQHYVRFIDEGVSVQYRQIVLTPQVVFDIQGCNVIVHGEIRPLTAREYRILRMLVENPDQFLSSTMLAEHLQNDEIVDERGIAQAIYTLRRKLGDCGRNPNILVTRRAIGYRILLPIPAQSHGRSEVDLK